MNKNNLKLKKLSQEKRENTYGGWAWLAAVAPYVGTALKYGAMALIGYKAVSATSGGIKYEGLDAKWNDSASSASRSVPKTVYYAY